MIPGGPEVLIIIGIIVLLFGASQIPKIARSIGRAKSEFEKGTKDGSQDKKEKIESADQKGDTEKSAGKED